MSKYFFNTYESLYCFSFLPKNNNSVIRNHKAKWVSLIGTVSSTSDSQLNLQNSIIKRLFTVLRKQARHIENDIDIKLVAFSKVGAGAGASTSSKTDDTSPLLREGVYDSLSAEIEQMLNKVVVEQLDFNTNTFDTI